MKDSVNCKANWRRKGFAKWERIEFGPLTPPDPLREVAEQETDRDTQKPIQQLMCDVIEEILDPLRSKEENLLHATKRMVSLMGRVALENRRSTNWLIGLTVVLTILTIAILILTFKMVVCPS
jgi:hypothetical protein